MSLYLVTLKSSNWLIALCAMLGVIIQGFPIMFQAGKRFVYFSYGSFLTLTLTGVEKMTN